jgi:CheY-like chemotaxis protein
VGDSPHRVLVVDDSDTIRALIVLNLELEGFEVHEARDGQECLDVVESVAPDVITLDVAMPRLDGFGAAARLRQRPRTAGIPIVMVTARALGSDVSRGAELGVAAYGTKPFEPSFLVEVVRSVARGNALPEPR